MIRMTKDEMIEAGAFGLVLFLVMFAFAAMYYKAVTEPLQPNCEEQHLG